VRELPGAAYAGGAVTAAAPLGSRPLPCGSSATDSGKWDDPAGKRSLLDDLARVAGVLGAGGERFHPDRGRLGVVRFLIETAKSLHCDPRGPDRAPTDER